MKLEKISGTHLLKVFSTTPPHCSNLLWSLLTGTWVWGDGGGGAKDIIGWRTTPNNFLSLSKISTCVPILLQAQIELPTKKSIICKKYHIFTKWLGWIHIKDINEVKFILMAATISITKSPTVVKAIMKHEKKYLSFSLGPLHSRASSTSGFVQKLINVSLKPTSTSCATNSGI